MPTSHPCLYQTALSAPGIIGGQDCNLKCDDQSSGEICGNCDNWYETYADGYIEPDELPSYCKDPLDGGDEIGTTPGLIEVPMTIE